MTPKVPTSMKELPPRLDTICVSTFENLDVKFKATISEMTHDERNTLARTLGQPISASAYWNNLTTSQDREHLFKAFELEQTLLEDPFAAVFEF